MTKEAKKADELPKMPYRYDRNRKVDVLEAILEHEEEKSKTSLAFYSVEDKSKVLREIKNREKTDRFSKLSKDKGPLSAEFKEAWKRKKEDNVAVREDSGARPSDLTKKYNNEMARGKGVNVLAPEPLKETIVENTRAVLTGDQPMVFDLETAKKLFAVMNGGREPNPLEVEKMKVNAKLSEKMYAAHGSSVSRVTAEVNKAVRDLAQPKQKDTNYVARAQDAARGK